MKLRLFDLDFDNDFSFDSSKPLRICIEAKTYFSKIIKALKSNNDCLAIFDDNGHRIEVDDIFVIFDYYSINSIIKAIIPKLYKSIDKSYNGDLELLNIIGDFNKCIDEIINYTTSDLNIEFEHSIDVGINDILKFVSCKPANDENDNSIDLTNFLYLIDRLSLFKVLVLANINSFFTQQQIIEIIKIAKYCRINLILIDDYMSKNKYLDEQLLIIDSDYYDVLL